MEEFIFGTLATDDLKLVHHRTARQGVQHAYEICPRDPIPGQPVTLQVTMGPQITARQVVCIYTTDGSQPQGKGGIAENGQAIALHPVKTIWDTFLWGYLVRWEGIIPGQPVGTQVRYCISAWSDDSPEIHADWPEVKFTVEMAAKAVTLLEPIPDLESQPLGDPVEAETFVYSVDMHAAPAWAYETVIYHIFVDRFSPGRGRDWFQSRNIQRFYGGTLWGVLEKLDYIEELGATCLWLSPTFSSPTTHGYDATDYFSVEPRMGGDEALQAVIDAVHARGMHVLLDLTCNHLSSTHPIFLDALNNPASRYRNWFLFDESDIGYRTFFGVASMPELNLDHPEARAWMLAVGRYWLSEFNADGYRLDHANGPNPGFWSEFYAACKAVRPNCLLLGEIVDTPEVQRRYLGRLDGILDFNFADALRRLIGHGTWVNGRFESFLARHHDYFPSSFLRPTFLDNHDMDRFLYVAGGDINRLVAAAELQMGQPSPPIIYYGTEIGMTQEMSRTSKVGLEVSRAPMIWDETRWNRDLLATYQRIIAERKDACPWA